MKRTNRTVKDSANQEGREFMCGITGFVCRASEHNNDELTARVARMTETLHHRGPDANGTWVDETTGIAVGHRRLSILDLSPAGSQPMHSACGRYVIVYNGEIYNYRELRECLEGEGHTFRGHSDTETLVEAIASWGLEEAVRRAIGMFAFAVWDKRDRRLMLVRDRLGIKPLYYGCCGDLFLFGSELKALKAHAAFDREIDRNALTLLVRHNYMPSPLSIYRGVFKLPPGMILTVTPETVSDQLTPVRYWSLSEAVQKGAAEPFRGTATEATAELERLLRDAIRLRMVADVPVGAFLSGGIDSSLVVALMQAESSRPVRTFSIGFDEPQYNEAPFAKAIAEHLGTDHVEHYVSAREALDVIPQLPTLYDEPFSDSSQIPTFLVSRVARQHVTVSLSGDGGDELFGGYNRYRLANSFWRTIRWLPQPIRQRLSGPLRKLGALRLPSRTLTRKFRTAGDVFAIPDFRSVYRRVVSHWDERDNVVIDGQSPDTAITDPAEWAWCRDRFQQMMYLDAVTYLPDDILVKVDRASMGVSLEARVPILDHRVVEFAWSLPLSVKVRSGQAKWPLRQVLERHVPRKLFERPKVGFGVPIDAWLRGPLRDWAEALLDENRLRQDGFFHSEPIRKKWEDHILGKRDWHYDIWDILMFQAWLDANRH